MRGTLVRRALRGLVLLCALSSAACVAVPVGPYPVYYAPLSTPYVYGRPWGYYGHGHYGYGHGYYRHYAPASRSGYGGAYRP